MAGYFGGPAINVQTFKPPVFDYYVLFDNAEEAIGVIARVDFNNRVETHVYHRDDTLRIFNRWGTERFYPCKGITKAEYETYIEFGIPDIGTETSWKKWLKMKLPKRKRK